MLNEAGFPDVNLVPKQAEPDPNFPTVSFPNPEEPGAMDLALEEGLDADADYRLEELLPDGVRSPVEYDPRFPESWAWWQEGVTLPGRILSGVGLRFPDLMPEHAVLVRLTRA